jgi:cell wall-associated NlpC family hydrolase
MKTKQADLAMKHLQVAQASVSSGKRAIGKLAANAYVSGGGFTDLDSLLKADGPQDLADRLSALDAVGQNNSTALDRYKSAEVVASSAQKAADTAKQAQAAATVKVASAKKAAEVAQAMQQDEVDKLQAVQDKLAKELAVAQKTRVTLEQQRQLALLEESNAGRAVLTPDQSKIWPDTGFTGRSTTRSTEAMRAAAVEYASKQVLAKKRYVWGDEGPTTFDCSGLVYAAYRAAGLGWPNWDRLNSSLYWVSTKRVPLKDLVPGDLLFYSYKPTVNTIHHISIYAGDGMMWEANSKDKGLLYSSIYSVKGLLPYGGRV